VWLLRNVTPSSYLAAVIASRPMPLDRIRPFTHCETGAESIVRRTVPNDDYAGFFVEARQSPHVQHETAF